MAPKHNQADFTFKIDGLPPNTFQVLRIQGVEEISRPFFFEITLVSLDDDIKLEAQIGQPARLVLRGHNGKRRVHGIVEELEHLGSGIKFSQWRAILAPTIARLKYTRNSRTFQDMSVVEIAEQVIMGHGIPADGLRKELLGQYGKRNFCVQYQESDLDFISRLLEEEGIFYSFDHEGDFDVMVLGDGEHAIAPLPDAEAIPFHDDSPATVFEEEAFFRFQASVSLKQGKATMRDFRFQQPGVNLEVSESAAKWPELENYYYPGEYVEPEVGQRLAQIRLEELQAQRKAFTGHATCRSLVPGYQFELEQYPSAKYNRAYLVLRVEHEVHQPQVLGEETGARQTPDRAYVAKVRVLPIDMPFRPPRVSPRPVIPGVQSAIVVGPEGEEIFCDEFGRVKVSFHWDRGSLRNETSSCWIRVSQPWAGAGYGGIFVPRVGQEVLVQFLEGDPDRPVIVGRVYNGENPVPYGLPQDRTKSTLKSSSSPGGTGFNELRFQDASGQEEVYLQAEKDWNILTKNNKSQTIGSNESSKVGASRTRSVGASESVSVSAAQSVSVGGAQSISVGTNQSTSVGANRNVSVTGNQSHAVTGNRSAQVQGSDSESVTGSQDVAVQGKRTVMVQGGQEAQISGGVLNMIQGGRNEGVQGGQNVEIEGMESHTVMGMRQQFSQGLVVIVEGASAEEVDGAKSIKSSDEATIEANGITAKSSADGMLHASGELRVSGVSRVLINSSQVDIMGGEVSISGGKIRLNA